MSSDRQTVILVDGENIDATLGNSIYGRKPEPAERPRWDRVIDFARRLWGQDVNALFFLNATSGYLPGPFLSALQSVGFRPVPLSGNADEKVVDIGIQRTLEALLPRKADVLLCSHDRDFITQVEKLLTNGRRVGIIGFPELVSGAYLGLDVKLYDIEMDVRAFNKALPRVRVISLDEFDPEVFLR